MISSTALATDLTTQTARSPRQQIIDLLDGFSIETTPGAVARQGAPSMLPAGTRVYVAFVPGEDWSKLIGAARRIRAAGLIPVPHFPARSIDSERTADDVLRQLTAQAGVDEVLVIGGGIDQPRGSFASTLDLLETGLFERHGVKKIAIAGHPEGEPRIGQPGVSTTHAEKVGYATSSAAEMRLVTQFLFDPAPLLAWEGVVRADGLAIHAGVPGPATLKTLLTYAKMCGIGNSMRVLTRQGGNLLRLARVSCPDALITALARHRAAEPASRIERLHFYPFGGMARTARWIQAVRDGAFTMNEDGLGFEVAAEAL